MSSKLCEFITYLSAANEVNRVARLNRYQEHTRMSRRLVGRLDRLDWFVTEKMTMSIDQWALSNRLCWSLALGWRARICIIVQLNLQQHGLFQSGFHSCYNSCRFLFLVTNCWNVWRNVSSKSNQRGERELFTINSLQPLTNWRKNNCFQFKISITMDIWHKHDRKHYANVVTLDGRIYHGHRSFVHMDWCICIQQLNIIHLVPEM